MKIGLSGFIICFLSLSTWAKTYSDLDPFRGKATMIGEVLATGCSIAFPDRYQTILLGEIPVKDLTSSRDRIVRQFQIHLDNCAAFGYQDKRRDIDPAIRIRFDGMRDTRNSSYFLPSGSGKGMVFSLRDERNEILSPGEYSQAIFDRSHNQQVLNFTLESVSDGTPVTAGDYSIVLRFNVDYE